MLVKPIKKLFIRIFIIMAIVGITVVANAANLLITTIYTADPDCLVANNAFYIYCGRDEAAAGQQAFVMDEWQLTARNRRIFGAITRRWAAVM